MGRVKSVQECCSIQESWSNELPGLVSDYTFTWLMPETAATATTQSDKRTQADARDLDFQ